MTSATSRIVVDKKQCPSRHLLRGLARHNSIVHLSEQQVTSAYETATGESTIPSQELFVVDKEIVNSSGLWNIDVQKNCIVVPPGITMVDGPVFTVPPNLWYTEIEKWRRQSIGLSSSSSTLMTSRDIQLQKLWYQYFVDNNRSRRVFIAASQTLFGQTLPTSGPPSLLRNRLQRMIKKNGRNKSFPQLPSTEISENHSMLMTNRTDSMKQNTTPFVWPLSHDDVLSIFSLYSHCQRAMLMTNDPISSDIKTYLTLIHPDSDDDDDDDDDDEEKGHEVDDDDSNSDSAEEGEEEEEENDTIAKPLSPSIWKKPLLPSRNNIVTMAQPVLVKINSKNNIVNSVSSMLNTPTPVPATPTSIQTEKQQRASWSFSKIHLPKPRARFLDSAKPKDVKFYPDPAERTVSMGAGDVVTEKKIFAKQNINLANGKHDFVPTLDINASGSVNSNSIISNCQSVKKMSKGTKASNEEVVSDLESMLSVYLEGDSAPVSEEPVVETSSSKKRKRVEEEEEEEEVAENNNKSDDDDDEDDEDDVFQKRPNKNKTPSATNGKKSVAFAEDTKNAKKKEKQKVESDDDEDEEEAAPPPAKKQKTSASTSSPSLKQTKIGKDSFNAAPTSPAKAAPAPSKGKKSPSAAVVVETEKEVKKSSKAKSEPVAASTPTKSKAAAATATATATNSKKKSTSVSDELTYEHPTIDEKTIKQRMTLTSAVVQKNKLKPPPDRDDERAGKQWYKEHSDKIMLMCGTKDPLALERERARNRRTLAWMSYLRHFEQPDPFSITDQAKLKEEIGEICTQVNYFSDDTSYTEGVFDLEEYKHWHEVCKKKKKPQEAPASPKKSSKQSGKKTNTAEDVLASLLD